MMDFMLSTDDAHALRRALELHLRSLMDELVKTEDHTYRSVLRRDYEHLSILARRLSAVLERAEDADRTHARE